jgi:hypothetical protein
MPVLLPLVVALLAVVVSFQVHTLPAPLVFVDINHLFCCTLLHRRPGHQG